MYSYLAPFLAPSFSSLSPRLTNPSFQLRQDTEGQAATLKELEEVGTIERFMKKEHPAEQCAMASVMYQAFLPFIVTSQDKETALTRSRDADIKVRI